MDTPPRNNNVRSPRRSIRRRNNTRSRRNNNTRSRRNNNASPRRALVFNNNNRVTRRLFNGNNNSPMRNLPHAALRRRTANILEEEATEKRIRAQENRRREHARAVQEQKNIQAMLNPKTPRKRERNFNNNNNEEEGVDPNDF